MSERGSTGAYVASGLEGLSLAYLVGTYPMLSMSFVTREILALRRMGFGIHVASINVPDRGAGDLTMEEAHEAQRTYYVKKHGVLGAALAHLRTLFTRPGRYWKGVYLAACMSAFDLRRFIMNIVYLTEGLMVGVWMQQCGQRHLHVHLGSQPATVGLFIREVFAFGFSITFHGPDEFYDVHQQQLRRKVVAADFVCCISCYTRSQLMFLSPRFCWNKLYVSRLGVDPAAFCESSKARDSSAIFEIICVGRLVPAKGQHILIDAVNLLARRGRQVCLRLVGAGPDRESLERAAAQVDPRAVVLFEGAVNQDRIRDLYAQADVFCIPSFAEGLPIALMEAMAMGIPCVSTHITGIPELIRDGTDGVLVAPSDTEGLANALSMLMDDGSLRDTLGRNGRARVIEHFDLGRSVDSLARIFERHIRAH